mgnify:CR=1 FL=1
MVEKQKTRPEALCSGRASASINWAEVGTGYPTCLSLPSCPLETPCGVVVAAFSLLGQSPLPKWGILAELR